MTPTARTIVLACTFTHAPTSHGRLWRNFLAIRRRVWVYASTLSCSSYGLLLGMSKGHLRLLPWRKVLTRVAWIWTLLTKPSSDPPLKLPIKSQHLLRRFLEHRAPCTIISNLLPCRPWMLQDCHRLLLLRPSLEHRYT